MSRAEQIKKFLPKSPRASKPVKPDESAESLRRKPSTHRNKRERKTPPPPPPTPRKQVPPPPPAPVNDEKASVAPKYQRDLERENKELKNTNQQLERQITNMKNKSGNVAPPGGSPGAARAPPRKLKMRDRVRYTGKGHEGHKSGEKGTLVTKDDTGKWYVRFDNELIQLKDAIPTTALEKIEDDAPAEKPKKAGILAGIVGFQLRKGKGNRNGHPALPLDMGHMSVLKRAAKKMRKRQKNIHKEKEKADKIAADKNPQSQVEPEEEKGEPIR